MRLPGPAAAVLATLALVGIAYEGSAMAVADWLGKAGRPGVVSLAYGADGVVRHRELRHPALH